MNTVFKTSTSIMISPDNIVRFKPNPSLEQKMLARYEMKLKSEHNLVQDENGYYAMSLGMMMYLISPFIVPGLKILEDDFYLYDGEYTYRVSYNAMVSAMLTDNATVKVELNRISRWNDRSSAKIMYDVFWMFIQEVGPLMMHEECPFMGNFMRIIDGVTILE